MQNLVFKARKFYWFVLTSKSLIVSSEENFTKNIIKGGGKNYEK